MQISSCDSAVVGARTCCCNSAVVFLHVRTAVIEQLLVHILAVIEQLLVHVLAVTLQLLVHIFADVIVQLLVHVFADVTLQLLVHVLAAVRVQLLVHIIAAVTVQLLVHILAAVTVQLFVHVLAAGLRVLGSSPHGSRVDTDPYQIDCYPKEHCNDIQHLVAVYTSQSNSYFQ